MTIKYYPKKSNDSSAKLFIAGIAILVIALVGYVSYSGSQKKDIYDRVTNCKITDKTSMRPVPVANHVVLIDQSEMLSKTQQDAAINAIREMVADAEEGERISIFTFSKNEFRALEPKISLCKPKSEGSSLTENVLIIKKKFIANFMIPVAEITRGNLSREFGEESPLLEALHSLALTAIAAPNGKPKKLFIISDMLQHKLPYTQYTTKHDYKEWKQKYGAPLVTSFQGWEVTALYLMRDNAQKYQTINHINFWQDYFYDAGTKISKLERVE